MRLALRVRPSQSNSAYLAFFLLFGSCDLRTFIGAALLSNMLFRVYLGLCRAAVGSEGPTETVFEVRIHFRPLRSLNCRGIATLSVK
jgi:hypothetical protein